MNKKLLLIFSIFLSLVLSSFIISADTCCEKLANPGPGDTDWCQMADTPDECDQDYSYRDNVGTCRTHAACQATCINAGGSGQCVGPMSESKCVQDGGNPDSRKIEDIPVCQEGCCVVGNYAYMMTNTACNVFATEINENNNFEGDEIARSIFYQEITNKDDCEAMVQSLEKGACVISNEFGERFCKILYNVDCTESAIIESKGYPDNWGGALLEGIEVEFFKDYLCTDKTIVNADCQKTDKTECKDDGKIYYKDSCNNDANIYNSERYKETGNLAGDYWSKIYNPYGENEENVCQVGPDGSSICGNCAIEGNTICKNHRDTDLIKPEQGDYVCGSLYCTFEDAAGNEIRYENGDTWCDGGITGALANTLYGQHTGNALSIYQDQSGKFTPGSRALLEEGDVFNTPGSRYFVLRCSRGEIKIDHCQDYRDEICIENVVAADSLSDNQASYLTRSVNGGNPELREVEQGYIAKNTASCEINLGKQLGCTHITNREACESGLAQCKWVEGYRYDYQMVPEDQRRESQGTCVPLVAPGLPFWNGQGAGFCAQGIVQENALFEVNIWRDRDDWDFDNDGWSIGGNGVGLWERCYDKCYLIPGYGAQFDIAYMRDPETGYKIYPQDIMERFLNVNWGESVKRKDIPGTLNEYEILSLFYDRSDFDLPQNVDDYYLSRRRGQYCHKLDDPDLWETGKVTGDNYDCADIRLTYDRNERKQRDYPVYLTHQEWLESITERARAFGDCGFKQNPEGIFSEEYSETISVIFQKLDQDGAVKRNVTAEKYIYKGDSSAPYKLVFDLRGESIILEGESTPPPCLAGSDEEEGAVCIIPPGYCETTPVGECQQGGITGVCCNYDFPEGNPPAEQ